MGAMSNTFSRWLLCAGAALAVCINCAADEGEDLLAKANNGDVTSQYKLAEQYYKANKFDEAVSWAKKASKKGNQEAKYLLANCYLEGKGIKKNLKAAFDLYLSCANKGMAAAQYELGRFYETGKYKKIRQNPTKTFGQRMSEIFISMRSKSRSIPANLVNFPGP